MTLAYAAYSLYFAMDRDMLRKLPLPLGGYEPTATTYGSSDSLQSTSLNDMLVGSAMQTWHSSWLWQHTHTHISTHKHIDHVRSTSNNRPHLSIPCMRCGRKNKNNIMGCLINRFSYA